MRQPTGALFMSTLPMHLATMHLVILLVLCLLAVRTTHAATFFGEDLNTTDDPGTPVDDPLPLLVRPSSDAARASFLAGLVGVQTQSLEAFPDSTSPPLDLTFGSDTATLSGSGYVRTIAPGATGDGVHPTEGSNLYFLFLLGGSSSFTVSFSSPQAALGFYATDVGDGFGELVLTIQLEAGGTTQVVVPSTPGAGTGSILYFGLVDAEHPFTSVTFTNTSVGGDGFGFDQLTIGRRDQVMLLDHFLLYRVKPTSDSPKFLKFFPFAPITLADQFRAADYQVVKPKYLGLPADKSGEGRTDAATHLEDYRVKPVAGSPKFAMLTDVQIANQCNTLRLEVSKPASILVPTLKSLSPPPPAPPDIADHQLDHYLCYKANPQKRLADGTALPKFPKGIQVVVADQFQSQPRRYDLKKIRRLCTPVDKSGTPVFVSGPNKDQPVPAITPAPIRHPSAHLVCYQAKLAKALIPQTGCGPTTPGDRGTNIEPPQEKHVKRTAVNANNQFGPGQLDTNGEAEFCIPSTKEVLPPFGACGNDLIDPGEDCEPPGEFCDGGCNPLTALCVDFGCQADCTCPDPVCGDTWLQASSEECDDGNTVSGDGCSESCTLEAPFCGGFAGGGCAPGEFCRLRVGNCDEAVYSGFCTPILPSCECSEIVDPVCGCDGETYANECVAICVGVNVASIGSCPLP